MIMDNYMKLKIDVIVLDVEEHCKFSAQLDGEWAPKHPCGRKIVFVRRTFCLYIIRLESIHIQPTSLKISLAYCEVNRIPHYHMNSLQLYQKC